MSDIAVPSWFGEAIEAPSTSHHLQVDGCRVHYRTWGERRRPGLLLVHGGAAHNHWWDFIAPLLTDHYFVVAPDLSGHGDSEWRQRYPRRGWADELLAVIEDVGFDAPPAYIGHSMGGLVGIVMAAVHGQHLAGAVIIDAPVRPHDPEDARRQRGQAFRNPKVYPDRETAIASFRLVPPQPCDNDFIVRHIAAHSLRPVEGGFTWKFDPSVFTLSQREPMEQHLQEARCRLSLIIGQKSVVVPPPVAAHMHALTGPGTPLVEIPEAYHHLLLDQPLPFVAALRTQLADWGHDAGA